MYDAVQAAGAEHGLVPAGLKALSSLRMEKAYRDFGHDIDNTDCPLEAGLGFAVALDKPGGFIGRDALLARKEANADARRHGATDRPGAACSTPSRCSTTPRSCCATASRSATSGPARTAGRSGRRSGWRWSRATASPVTPDWLSAGSWEVDVAGTRYPAEVSLRPMYDPTSARVRA